MKSKGKPVNAVRIESFSDAARDADGLVFPFCSHTCRFQEVWQDLNKDFSIIVDCPEDLTVFHDSKWTSEALFNLLDNAVKYTPAGGKIAVSVVLWEMYVEIKVTDTGKGISESNQAAIFRRFYREEEVHEQQGVGIGLYLAREIVTRQGGYIKVVSEPGKGSEFSIMLPTK